MAQNHKHLVNKNNKNRNMLKNTPPSSKSKGLASSFRAFSYVASPFQGTALSPGGLVIKAPRSAATSNGTADKSVHGDPYLGKSKTQYLHKLDYSIMNLVASECLKDSTYSDPANTATAQGCKRVLWNVPYRLKQKDASSVIGKTTDDVRGNFADIGSTVISFKNCMKQPIRVLINSPRARIDDSTGVYLRVNKLEYTIRPGKIFLYRTHYGDKANIFTPWLNYVPDQVSNIGKNYYPAFAVADFCVIIPDVDEMSGTLPDQTLCCTVKLKQHYFTSTFLSAATELRAVDPFVLQKLSLQDALFEKTVVVPTSVSVTSGVGPMVLKKYKLYDNIIYALSHKGGGPVSMDVDPGDKVVTDCFSGTFKYQDGMIICWDEDIDQPISDADLTAVIHSGSKFRILNDTVMITFTDLIGYLTALTEIIRVVSVFF